MSLTQSSLPNPFSASFGLPDPGTLISRDAQVDEFIQGLADRPGSTYRSILISGTRGVGKTTLMTVMADRARQIGWVTASVTTGPGLAERILDKATLAAEHLLPPEPRRLLTGIALGGFALTSAALPAKAPTWWRRISQLLDILEANETGLMIAIDEVHRREPDLQLLLQQYQELVNERRNLSIVMTGLPEAVEAILTKSTLTFVQRAHRQHLGAIPHEQMTAAYIKAVSEGGKRIKPDVARRAASETQGLPYLFQLVGYFAWQESGDRTDITISNIAAALPLAHNLAERNLYELEISALTPREREFLQAMLIDDDNSRVSDLAQRLQITSTNASFYRSQLVARGLIQPAGRGFVRFSSRLLRKYLVKLDAAGADPV